MKNSELCPLTFRLTTDLFIFTYFHFSDLTTIVFYIVSKHFYSMFNSCRTFNCLTHPEHFPQAKFEI